jgi:large subunit ribosomal protein L21
MLNAIIITGGKQYNITKGATIDVEKLEGDSGKLVTFKPIFYQDQNNILIGTPFVDSYAVLAKIVSHLKAPKVIIFKKNKRKGFMKKVGHRQPLTRLLIEDIISADNLPLKEELIAKKVESKIEEKPEKKIANKTQTKKPSTKKEIKPKKKTETKYKTIKKSTKKK